MYANSLTIGLILTSLLAVSANEVVHHPSPAVLSAPVLVDSQPKPPGQLDSLLSPESPMVVGGKPEQYGAPEPAGMPANYKPFGSWGLYVGGNPPDGYYTNFYKSLDGVQGVPSQQAPPVGVQHQGFYKQSGPVPFGANQYPYVYSTGELNSAVPVGHNGYPSSYSSFDGPEFYATKKVGSPAQQAREISKTSSSSSSNVASGTKGSVEQQQQAKGYAHAYASPLSHSFQQPQQAQYQHYSQPNQVVPYSVPVGSQIVGSQPGADGAFSPYGVHAFTRYAVKPAFNAGQQGQYQQYHQSAQQHYQPSAFQSNYGYHTGYQNYYPFQGVPLFSYQYGPAPVAPVAPVATAVPVAPVASVSAPVAAPASALETPVVPSSNVAQAEPQQTPQSPVQVGQAALASPSLPTQQEQNQQQVEQQQVVEKQAETKSAGKQ